MFELMHSCCNPMQVFESWLWFLTGTGSFLGKGETFSMNQVKLSDIISSIASSVFIFRHFHPSLSSLSCYASTPQDFLVFLTIALLTFLFYSILKSCFTRFFSCILHLYLYRSSRSFGHFPFIYSFLPPIPSYPLSPLFPPETIPPPFLVILHPPLPPPSS